MAKGKDPATCLTMNIAWTVAPWNIILQLVIGVYNFLFSFLKIIKKIINFTLYYITVILIIIFKGIHLNFVAKMIRFIADQFIIANTKWDKRMKNCQKIGRLSKKINVAKFKRQIGEAFGAAELNRDPEDKIEDEKENNNNNNNNNKPSGRTSWGQPGGNISESSTDENAGDKSMMYSMLGLGAVFLALYLYTRKENETKLNINKM
jgi:hypothetical protein